MPKSIPSLGAVVFAFFLSINSFAQTPIVGFAGVFKPSTGISPGFTGLYVSGNYAYVGDSFNNILFILDITDPTSPQLVGSISDGAGGAALTLISSVFVVGNYCYVTSKADKALEIIDVTNKSSPVHAGKIVDGSGIAPFIPNPNEVSVFGNYAYVVSDNFVMEIVDVSNPASPSHVSSLTLSGNPQSVFATSGYAYVASLSFGLSIVDVSNPLIPTVVGTLQNGQGGALLYNPTRVEVKGNYAYVVARNSNTLEIVDISNPASPSHVGGLSGAAPIGTSVIPFGNYLATSSDLMSGKTMQIIDITTPSAPQSVTSFGASSNGSTFDVQVSGNYLYSASWGDGFNVFSIFTPPPPVVSTSLITNNSFTASWAASSASSFQVDVSTDNFATFVTGYNANIVSTTTVNITGLNANTTYQCRVRGLNANGQSLNSKVVTVLTGPSAPATPTASSITQNSFTVNWNAVSGATTYYLDVSTGPSFGSTLLPSYTNLPVTSTSQGVFGLSAGTTYYFQVRSANSGGSSPSSPAGTTITVPPNPVTQPASAVSTTSFNANWSNSISATGYYLDVASTSNFSTMVAGYSNLALGNVTTDVVNTGITAGTTYYYQVRAFNASGTSSSSGPITVITLPAAPVAAAASTVAQTTFNANWGAVQSATAYLLDVSASADFVQILTNYNALNVGNVLTLTVNGLTAGTNYYYRVRAVNPSGNSVPSNVITVLTAAATTTQNIPTLSSGGTLSSYAMFSIPKVLDKGDSTIATLFSSLGDYTPEKWRLLRWNAASSNWDEYLKGLSTIDRGKSYWFNSMTSATISVTGADFELPSFNLKLTQGWNQIGSPYDFDVSWADVLAQNSSVSGVGSVETSLYKYVQSPSGFAKTDNLKAWGGAYLFNGGSAITLAIPFTVKHAVGGRIQNQINGDANPENWFLPLKLTVGGLENGYSGFGMNSNAKVSYDSYDGITVPRFLTYVELNSYHPEFFAPAFSQDVVPNGVSFDWHFMAETNSESSDAILTWENSVLGNSSSKLVLFDPSTGSIVDMKATNEFHFQLTGAHPLRFFYANSAENFKPDVTCLADVYPNPASSIVTFPFFVSESGAVRIDVYDMLGKKVRTVVNGVFQPGLQQAQWDTIDDYGGKVSTGLYVYQFVGANNTVQSGKVLIK